MSRIATIGVTQRVAGAMLLALLMVGCDKSSKLLPSAPSVSPQSLPQSQFVVGPYSISGIVAGDNGQPVTNATVNAWVDLGSRGSYSYSYAHGPLYTDASGGYRIPSLPAGALVWVKLTKAGYVQPCAGWSMISGDVKMDLAIVSTANLTAPLMPS